MLGLLGWVDSLGVRVGGDGSWSLALLLFLLVGVRILNFLPLLHLWVLDCLVLLPVVGGEGLSHCSLLGRVGF